MAFMLQEVVPWGRNFHEYQQMFLLRENDLQRKILGIGDGPASFNCELTRRGGHVCSCDPVYQFSAAQIRQRIQETSAKVERQTKENEENFVWTSIRNPDELIRIRHRAMDLFLKDYELWETENDAGAVKDPVGRYVAASLPSLPFKNGIFDLALSSHFLFLYEEQLDESFHLQSVRELLRVASEVRIFPILTLDAKPSSLVDPVCRLAEGLGAQATIETVDYEFQRGGNKMLRITRKAEMSP